MADLNDSQSSPSSGEEPPLQPDADHLQYPHIYLETSFDSLLRNSYASHSSSSNLTMTRSTHAPEPRPPALSESWASISDAELSQNDELSEQTDGESLVDVRNDDDILSSHEVEESDDDEDEDEDAHLQDPPQDHDTHIHTMAPSPQQSLSDSSFVPTYILLDETNTSSHTDNVLVRHTLKMFSEEETSTIYPEEPNSELVGTIDLTLNKLSLKDNGRQSLRLLLLGDDYLPSLRESIVNKVADALVSSGTSFTDSQVSSPSRYHIVPDSFGPGSVPSTAEMIPIDCQLEVDRFNKVTDFKDWMTLSDATTGKSLVCYDKSSFLSHDMAIIITKGDESDETANTLSAFMRLVNAHSIPSIVITVDNNWTCALRAPVSGIHRAIHVRPVWDGLVLRWLPLDIDTFLNLNSAQLSRHLSWLVENARTDWIPYHDQGAPAKYGTIQGVLRAVGPVVKHKGSIVLGMFILSLTLSCLIALSIGTGKVNGPAMIGESTESLPCIPSTTPVVTTRTSTLIISTTSTTASASPSIPLTIDASKSTSGKFEIEVIGSSHLVVRTPQKNKGKSPLKIVLSRQGELIPAEIKLLFPCVYSVYVPAEHLHGEITVRLEMPNPRLVDTIKLDLGSQSLDAWLKQMLEHAEHDIQANVAVLQNNLQRLYRPETRYKLVEQAKVLAANISEALGLERRIQEPLRRFDAKRMAFNERIDDLGEEYIERANHWLAHFQATHHGLPKKAAKLVQCRLTLPSMPRMKIPLFDAVRHGFGARQRWRDASNDLLEKHAQRMATAQGRARHLVGKWRQKKDGKRGH